MYMKDAFSLEPTGTAERHMKAGRGHVCNMTVCWSRSNSSGYSPCRYRAPCIGGRIRLFGANIFPLSFDVASLLLLAVDSLFPICFGCTMLMLMLNRAGRPCPCICPHCCPKRTKTSTCEEAERQEESSGTIGRPIGFSHVSVRHMCMLNYGDLCDFYMHKLLLVPPASYKIHLHILRETIHFATSTRALGGIFDGYGYG